MTKTELREFAQNAAAVHQITRIPTGKTTLTPSGKPKPLTKAQQAEIDAAAQPQQLVA